jgi:hypothetical protein
MTEYSSNYLSREEYNERLTSLEQAVNPKPITREEMDKVKQELLRKQKR